MRRLTNSLFEEYTPDVIKEEDPTDPTEQD
jgi:hypothetical protein